MLNNLRKKVIHFLDSKEQYPFISALAAGLYPLLYYYNSNFTLVNSWSQFLLFIISFLLIPCIIFYVLHHVVKKIDGLKKYSKYVTPILNLCLFAFLIVLNTYGFRKKILFALLIAFVLSIILNKHFKKIIVFQFLLAALVFVKLIPDFYKHLTYSNEWIEQPDAIEEVVFTKRPNIYIIQPDGYANFYELKRGYYDFNNSEMELFLISNNFKLYNKYRSNYYSTLSSNSSMFAMKHHYYNNTKSFKNELYNAREIIVGDNPVISILKKNNYKTFLLLEKSYLLLNRPKIFYDFCNVNFNEVSFLARGFELDKNIKQDFEQTIENNSATNNFYFIEKLSPGHISVYKHATNGKEIERKNYLNDIKKTNEWLKDITKLILEKDKNSLIVIVADHGGFVGMDYTLESKIKQIDRDLIYSIFTSALAIKWPNEAPVFDNKLKTSVNLFRILFSYLGEDESYLENLQEDKSYIQIDKGAPIGVYEYINENGEAVFNRITK